MTSTRTSAALALLALCASGCFLWPQPSGTPERPTVLQFDIEGTKAVSGSELAAHLATQPSGRKYLIVPAPQSFDVDAFANDQKRIVRYYEARGYYHARVESADAIPAGPGKVRLRVRVVEGPPVRVTSVEVAGLDAAPEAKQRLGKLPLANGDVFTEAGFDAGRAALLAALTSTGWAKAEVEQHAQVDPTLDEAHVSYSVKPGQRYRFGPVFVAGAAVVPRSRVREEAEIEVKTGATFDATELPKAQARVFDLGVFGGVRVSQGPADEAKQQIPAVVSVREAPFRTIRAGPGFTFQATRWEADAIAGWSHRNWLGGLRKLNLDARVGYAWLPTLLNPQKSGPVALFSADFTQPGVATRYVDLNLRAEVERGREQAYDFWAERIRLGTPFKLGRLVTFVPSVNLELYELGNIVTQNAVTESGTPNPQALQLTTCPGQDPSLCLLSYFEQRLVFDFRDDPINTTRGLYVALAVQEGFSVKGNGASYLRFLPEARAFASLPFGFVLAGRARIGVLSGSSEVPIIARFTSGGPNLMRGYYTRQLSPVLGYCSVPLTGTPPACPSGNFQYLPVGGAGLIDGSIELRFPIAGELGGATFLDFGNVRVNAADALNVANLQYAVGAGIRYKTVFGPLRVDLAARIPGPNGQPGVEILNLCPIAGCSDTSGTSSRSQLVSTGTFHHDPIVSFHLSIGEAF